MRVPYISPNSKPNPAPVSNVHRSPRHHPRLREDLPFQPAEVHGPEAYFCPTTMCGAISPRSGTDSDHLADGSIAALHGQTAAKTNYLNQRFLLY